MPSSRRIHLHLTSTSALPPSSPHLRFLLTFPFSFTHTLSPLHPFLRSDRILLDICRNDSNAGAGADSRCAGGYHFARGFDRANPATRLHLNPFRQNTPDQLHVVHSGTA